MAKVLILGEHRDGKIKKSTTEIVAAISAAGHETSVAVLGDTGLNALVAELGAAGATRVLMGEHAALKLYNSEAYAAALAPVVKAEAPEYILAAHSPQGRDLMPQLSQRLEAGLASDCNSIQCPANGPWTVRRPVYAGKASVEVEFLGSGPKMISVRPNTFGAPKGSSSKSATAVNISSQIATGLGSLRSKTLDVVKGNSARPDVTEAAIVVSGGRSLKNAENFKILEEMADVLGAAVGASRAAVDAGYRPHRDQVGQTGKVVSPTLYIACGISGAIQHLAGMRTSKTIVAVNTDPEAPIFQVADYGIVGDLFTLVPLLTQEFKKLKEH
jgi:electron transfer flavoprotein alpha subunit